MSDVADMEAMKDESFEAQDAGLLWDVPPPYDPSADISAEDNSFPEIFKEPTATPLREGGAGKPLCSSQLYTPLHQKEFRLPFPSCNESPINGGVIVASTPFHGRTVSSNTTYSHAPNQNGDDAMEKLITNATFDIGNGARLNDTGPLNTVHQNIANGTFVKEENRTFNMKVQNATFDTKPAEKVSTDTDIMESCTQIETSNESGDSVQRQPLKKISPEPNVKPDTRGSSGLKKPSRIGAPRMNAAAISRIKARSPQPLKNATNTTSDLTNHSNSNKELKKPPTRARKSLLQTDVQVGKFGHRSKFGIERNLVNNEQQNKNPSKQKVTTVTPTKRKARESPKPSSRLQKVAVTRTGQVSGLPRAIGTENTRPASRISRPQRPSGLVGPSANRARPVSSAKKTSGNVKAGAKKDVKNSSGESTRSVSPKAKKLVLENKTSHKDIEKLQALQHNSNCAIVFATLFNHVANNLNGLSAPELSLQVEHLQKIISKKDELNTKLSAQIIDLEAKLAESKNNYETALGDVQKEQVKNAELQDKISNLFTELENERQNFRERTAEFNIEKEELNNKFESEISRIQEEQESESEALRCKFENDIKIEVEERMKPYINARSEVESLTTVLEMKNQELHRLQAQCSSFSLQQNDVDVLNHKVEKLTQKNEDLEVQIQDRMNESRKISEECSSIKQSLTEERSRSAKLRRRNEELTYRLESTGSPASPSFNPVFTTSPPQGSGPSFEYSSQNSFYTPARTSPDFKNPRSLTYDKEDDHHANGGENHI